MVAAHALSILLEYNDAVEFSFIQTRGQNWVEFGGSEISVGNMNRRRFLVTGGLACLGTSAWAIEPIQRSGKARMRLSLAGYSFREFFRDNVREGKREGGRQIDLFDFIDYCAEQECDAAELTAYYFPKEITPEFLLKLKRHAFLRGIAISGTAVGNNFAHPKGAQRTKEIESVKQWIRYASIMGAPHIRIFAGAPPHGTSKEEAKKLCIEAIEECAADAAQYGVFLGVENHGGIVAEASDLLDLIKTVKSPWVGINLDTGNFRTDDPYRDLARCAPYAVNAQIKSEIQKRGQKKEAADLKRLVQILRDVNYQGFVALEYEAAEDPWKAVPGLLKELKGLLA
jgi:sugar phosphate isomerase/epimerase